MALPEETHIAIVEDDEFLRGQVKEAFEAEGFFVTAFHDAIPFMRHVHEYGLPHLALIDLKLPAQHGFQLSEELKALGDVPIVFITSEKEADTIIKALTKYADDYVTKPFAMGVLVARVVRVLSRVPHFDYARSPVIHVDDWLSIDFAKGRLLLPGSQVVPLTPTEANLLYILVGNRDRVVSSDVLLARVWPFEEVYEDTLRVHMHRLRGKLEPDRRQPRYIHTVRGIGYLFKTPAVDPEKETMITVP